MDKINWDEWEECTEKESEKDMDNRAVFKIGKECFWYRRKEKDTFKDKSYTIHIGDKALEIFDHNEKLRCAFYDSLPLLIEAIEEGKRRFGWGK